MDRRIDMEEFNLQLTVDSLSEEWTEFRSNTQSDSQPCLSMRICFISQLFVVFVLGAFSDN